MVDVAMSGVSSALNDPSIPGSGLFRPPLWDSYCTSWALKSHHPNYVLFVAQCQHSVLWTPESFLCLSPPLTDKAIG